MDKCRRCLEETEFTTPFYSPTGVSYLCNECFYKEVSLRAKILSFMELTIRKKNYKELTTND